MELETPRLLLREFQPADWPAVHAYESDPLVARYMPWAAGGEAESRAHLQRCLDDAQELPRRIYELAIVRKDDGKVIGECTLALNPHERRQAAFSYLLNRKYWGNGYATEAMKRLFDFGFGDLGLVRLADSVDARNRAAQRVLENWVCAVRAVYARSTGARAPGTMKFSTPSWFTSGGRGSRT